MAINLTLNIKTYQDGDNAWIAEIEAIPGKGNKPMKYRCTRGTEPAAIAAVSSKIGSAFLKAVDREGVDIEF